MKTLAIVGRPNVGKSTLFNRLTRTRSALVYDKPGVTRDRQYGHTEFETNRYVLIDTGGIGLLEGESLADDVIKQTELAIAEADLILLMVDGRVGAMPDDFQIVEKLRGQGKPVFLVINKIDGQNELTVTHDFYQFGFKAMYAISAEQKQGTTALLQAICEQCPSPLPNTHLNLEEDELTHAMDQPIKVAIVGRPNAGKSTLINRMLGDERVIVSPIAGTTRDSIYIPFTHLDQDYVLIDTAGVRRKSKVNVAVEKFSVIKTLKAIEDCHVAVMLFNAQDAIVDQDLHLLGYILESGKSLVIAINKWDGLSGYQRGLIVKGLDRKLHFVNFAKQKFISALHGTGVGELYPLIKRAYRSAFVTIKTAELNQLVQTIIEHYTPPLVSNRRVKFRYVHIGGHNPPTIVIHGSRVSQLPKSYQRYLSNALREALKLQGTPIFIKFVEANA